MSRLAHEINATLTGDHKLKRMKYVTTDREFAPASMMTSKGVRMEAKFSHTVWVNELGRASEGEMLAEATYDAKRAIIEEVFGEFRPLIIEMRNALHDVDTTQIRRLLAELEHQMFVDGM